jgi:hypothetical protein
MDKSTQFFTLEEHLSENTNLSEDIVGLSPRCLYCGEEMNAIQDEERFYWECSAQCNPSFEERKLKEDLIKAKEALRSFEEQVKAEGSPAVTRVLKKYYQDLISKLDQE